MFCQKKCSHFQFILDRSKLYCIIIVLSRDRSLNFKVGRGVRDEETIFWKFLNVTYYKPDSPFELEDQKQCCTRKREAKSLFSVLFLNSLLLLSFPQLHRCQQSLWLLWTHFFCFTLKVQPRKAAVQGRQQLQSYWKSKNLISHLLFLFNQLCKAKLRLVFIFMSSWRKSQSKNDRCIFPWREKEENQHSLRAHYVLALYWAIACKSFYAHNTPESFNYLHVRSQETECSQQSKSSEIGSLPQALTISGCFPIKPS